MAAPTDPARPDGPVTETFAAPGGPVGVLAPGALLGARYRIGELIGAGGMGRVYRAYDNVLDLEVALKSLGPGTTLERLADLRDEVRLAQRVTHPNVCRTFDLEELDGLWVIKMELLAGETLAARLRRSGALPVDEALAVARGALAGLAAAHAAHVVHGDLKPQNLMLLPDGRAVLMDFGVARAEHASATSGTPLYAAPEQLRGEALGPRSDVWSMGAVIFELLTGRPPYPGSTTLAAARERPSGPPPDPAALRPEIPARVATAVRKALAAEPEARFAGAAELAAALAPVPGRRRWLLAGGGLALAGAAVAVAMAVGGSGGGSGGDAGGGPGSGSAWRPDVRPLPGGHEENADDPAWSPDGRFLAYTSDREDRGSRRWRVYVEPAAGGEARAITPPGAYSPRWSRDGRSILYYDHTGDRVMRQPLDGGAAERLGDFAYQADDCGAAGVVILRHHLGQITFSARDARGERVLARVGGAVPMARCDGDGRRVVFSLRESGRGNDDPAALWLLDVAAGTTRVLLDDGHANLYASFARDGRSVIYSSDRPGAGGAPGRHLWELALDRPDAAPRQLTFGDGPDMASDASPDGRRLIFDVDTGSSQLFVVPLGEPAAAARRLSTRLEQVTHPAVSPDGARIAAEVRREGRSVIVTWDAARGGEHVLGEGARPMYAPSGALVFTRDQRLWVLPAGGGAARALAEVPGAPVALGVDWEDHVALVVREGDRQVGRRVPLDGGPALSLPEPWLADVALPDGWRLALSQASLRVLAPGRTIDDPPHAELPPGMFRWSLDGREVFYVTDGELHRHALASGEDRVVLREGGLIFHAWTPGRAGELVIARTVGSVRRFVIENFGERPR